MVLLRESRMTQPAIAAAMGVSLSTVNRAHMAYDQGGIKALKPICRTSLRRGQKRSSDGRWLFQFGVVRETTMLLRSTLMLAAVLVAGSTSASMAARAKHSEQEKSYTRAPMRARSIAPRMEFGAAATKNVKPFTIEEQRWFNQANGSRW
jgi:Winged helix-turn helix